MDEYPDVPRLALRTLEPLIQSYDLLVCSGRSPMSKMIQEATNSIYSHVGFLLRADVIGCILVLESVESIGCSPVELSHYVEDYGYSGHGYPGKVYVARDPRLTLLPPDHLKKFAQRAIKLFRRGYDNKMIGLIGWRLMCERLGLPVTPRKDDDAYICSEYVCEGYTSVGLSIDTLSPGFIAPRDFVQPGVATVLWEIAIDHGEE